MAKAGVCNGDYAVVRRQTSAKTGDMIVAVLDNQATVKYYHPKKTSVQLRSANDHTYSVVRSKDLQIHGKVIGAYKPF